MTGFLTQLSPEVRRQIIDLLAQVGIERGRIDEILSGSSTVDHGALIGLGDNDHPQYALLTALNDEATLRANQDVVLQNNIDVEAAARVAADALKADISYVDSQDALSVAKAGDTMTGSLTISGSSDLNVDSSAVARDPAVNIKAQSLSYAPSIVMWTGGARKHLIGNSADKFRIYDYTLPGNLLSQKTAGVGTLVFASPPEVPTPTAVTHAANMGYVDTGDAANTAAIDAHVTDLVDAHDANSIGFSYDGGSSLINGWLGGAATVEEAVEVLSAQLYTPDEETVEAMIAAANALVIADPNAPGVGEVQFNNSDIFASNVVVARHIVAGSIDAAKIAAGAVTADKIDAGAVTTDKLQAEAVTAAKIAADTITATQIAAGTITATEIATGTITAGNIAANAITSTKLATDAITSTNYIAPPLPGDYAIAGSYLNLTNGDFQSAGILLDGVSGDVSIKGDIEADTFILNQAGVERSRFFTAPTSLWADDAGFDFKHPASVAARVRGVSGDAGTSFGIDDALGDFNQIAMRATAWSELTGGDDYQSADAAFTLKTNINTGVAIAQITAGGLLTLPTGSGFNSQNSITVYGYGEGGSGNFGTYISGPLDVNSNTTIGSTGTPVTLTHSGPFKSQSATFADFEVHRTSANYSMIQYSNSAGDLGKVGFTNTSQFAIRCGGSGSDDLTFTGDNLRIGAGGFGGIETSYGDTNKYVNMGYGLSGYSTWGGVEGKYGVLLLTNATSGQIYLRNKSSSGSIFLGVATSNRLEIKNAGAYATGVLSATSTVESTRQPTTSWTTGSILANTGSGNTSMVFHPGGIALQLRVGYNVGTMYVRNSADSGTYTVYAYHAVPSSGEWKHDVQTWGKGAKAKRLGKLRPDTNITGSNRPVDDPDIPSPLEAVKKLRTVAYRLDKTEQLDRVPPDKRRQEALGRLNEMRHNRGLGPFQSEETIHMCGRDCDGTLEDPCVYVKDWEKGRVGFISEELAEVLPEAVRCDPISGKWNGIDTLAVTAAAVGAIQEQQEIIDGLLARIEALEAKK